MEACPGGGSWRRCPRCGQRASCVTSSASWGVLQVGRAPDRRLRSGPVIEFLQTVGIPGCHPPAAAIPGPPGRRGPHMWLSKVQALSWTHSPVILKMLETGVLLHAEQKNLKASVPIGYLYYSGENLLPARGENLRSPAPAVQAKWDRPLVSGEKRDMLDTSETEKGRNTCRPLDLSAPASWDRG